MNWNAIALALLHFLWQGALLGGVSRELFICLRNASAQTRYVACCLVLLCMAACPFLTLAAISGAPQSGLGEPGLLFQTGDLRIVVFLWFGGAAVLGMRLLGGLAGLIRLTRTDLTPVPTALEARFQALANRLRIPLRPRIFASSRVAVPTAVGFLRGTVLLPVSHVAGLPSEMVEALILHELAHVARFDVLVNALQSFVQVLLYYHPAVWWLSNKIREERENCCDDVVVGLLNDRPTYVRALALTAEMGQASLALRSNDGDLLGRIRRILGHKPSASAVSPLPIAMLLVTLLVMPMITGFHMDHGSAITASMENLAVHRPIAPAKTTKGKAVPKPGPGDGPARFIFPEYEGQPLVVDLGAEPDATGPIVDAVEAVDAIDVLLMPR